MATRSRRTSPNDPVPDRSEDTSKVRGRSPLAGPIAAVNREVRERHYVSSSEAANRSQLSQLPPPTVKRALVHATSVLTTREGERVLSVDMRPLVIHLLAALEQAGIERAVVTLGHNATQVAECVTEYGFTRLQIDFVYLTLGSAVGAVWCSLANSVIAARALFTGKEPLLIVRADNLYDCRLLRKIADAPFGKNRRLQAYALVDDTPTAVGWATSVRNNWARVALATHDRQCAVRCSPRLGSFDAVVAGEVYATTPQLFEVLTELFRERASTSLADAMSELADRGALGVVQVGELDRHWFESRTLATIFKDETRAQGGLSSAGSSRPWAHIAQAARELLYSGEWRPTANMPTPPLRGDIEKLQMPMLQLGPTLGEGVRTAAHTPRPPTTPTTSPTPTPTPTRASALPPAASRRRRRRPRALRPRLTGWVRACLQAHGLVVEAEAGPSVGSFSKLAVKMVPINKGGDTEEGGGVMEAVMSEVHALRHLSGHENIVKLIDVVELNAAVYIVLERIGGPGLDEHLLAQPRGVLPEPQARQFFRHLLAALRHAHARGFLHCDVKPANVRLQLGPREGELTAVLVSITHACTHLTPPLTPPLAPPLTPYPSPPTRWTGASRGGSISSRRVSQRAPSSTPHQSSSPATTPTRRGAARG